MFANSSSIYTNSVGEMSSCRSNSKFKWELCNEICVDSDFYSVITDHDAEAKIYEDVATIEDIEIKITNQYRWSNGTFRRIWI